MKSLFGFTSSIRLEEKLKIPNQFSTGIVKGRFLYNDSDFRTEFRNYTATPVRSLKITINDEIDYNLKYTDRRIIQTMLLDKGEADDILILKHGLITDSSIANIVFFDGEKWYTPESPLLKGTTRERLLSEKRINPLDIRVEDLKSFTHFRLINSMLDFEEQEMIETSSIQ